MSSDCLYLCLSLPGSGKGKIALAGGAAFSGVGPDQARLMLALADVLAESADCGATGQAVADLRMLATAPSGRVLQWMGTTGQLRPGQRQFQVPAPGSGVIPVRAVPLAAFIPSRVADEES